MREARAERERVRVKRAKDGGESEEGTTVAASDGRDNANDAATAGPNAGYPGYTLQQQQGPALLALTGKPTKEI